MALLVFLSTLFSLRLFLHPAQTWSRATRPDAWPTDATHWSLRTRDAQRRACRPQSRLESGGCGLEPRVNVILLLLGCLRREPRRLDLLGPLRDQSLQVQALLEVLLGRPTPRDETQHAQQVVSGAWRVCSCSAGGFRERAQAIDGS